MMKGSRISELLKEAGHYNEVKNILTNLAVKDSFDYPVYPFISDDGKTKWRVSATKVREEASKLCNALDCDKPVGSLDDFYNLYPVVHTHADILLLILAIHFTHRNETEEDINNIRDYVILDNLLLNLDSDEEDCEWSIQEGWKRRTKGGVSIWI